MKSGVIMRFPNGKNGTMKAILFATLTVAVLALAVALPGFSATDGSGTWTRKAPLPVSMAEVGVAALNSKIYAVGGTEQEGKGPVNSASTLNMMYDPEYNTWHKQAPLPHALSHAGAAMGSKLYAIGGFTTPIQVWQRFV